MKNLISMMIYTVVMMALTILVMATIDYVLVDVWCGGIVISTGLIIALLFLVPVYGSIMEDLKDLEAK